MSTFIQVAVLIGRFQPFHNGHAALLRQALQTAPRVIVVLGSACQARDAKDPFTSDERAAMIDATLDAAERARVQFAAVRDGYDEQRWAASVTAAVEQIIGLVVPMVPMAPVALIGHHKDLSSAYLNRFPRWTLVEAGRAGEIDATRLRQIYFEGDDADVIQALLATLAPPAVCQYLKGWARLPHYARLREEHRVVEAGKKKWGTGPFITVDAVVRAADHVLLIQRARSPGKGMWALPGGFLEPRERVLAGAIRELREETGFALLDSDLEAALSGVAVFDHPDRSLRGRTITHAHFFDIVCTRPPQVAAADDAAAAKWVPVTALREREAELFEDHFHILNHFLNLRV